MGDRSWLFILLIVCIANDNGIIKERLLSITAVEITILAKKGDGIIDAVKMDPFF